MWPTRANTLTRMFAAAAASNKNTFISCHASEPPLRWKGILCTPLCLLPSRGFFFIIYSALESGFFLSFCRQQLGSWMASLGREVSIYSIFAPSLSQCLKTFLTFFPDGIYTREPSFLSALIRFQKAKTWLFFVKSRHDAANIRKEDKKNKKKNTLRSNILHLKTTQHFFLRFNALVHAADKVSLVAAAAGQNTFFSTGTRPHSAATPEGPWCCRLCASVCEWACVSDTRPLAGLLWRLRWNLSNMNSQATKYSFALSCSTAAHPSIN